MQQVSSSFQGFKRETDLAQTLGHSLLKHSMYIHKSASVNKDTANEKKLQVASLPPDICAVR